MQTLAYFNYASALNFPCACTWTFLIGLK